MKKLRDLTLKDNFMFSAVMMDGDNCKRLLEMVLEIPIAHIEIDYEKNIIYHPEYHGIRLDIIANDEENTQYSVEMQVLKTPIEKRSRYYHSQIDMDILLKGEGYEKLPDVYVIFICDYDPFGYEKYRYNILPFCPEVPTLYYNDGRHTIYLSTRGKNREEVPEELVKFLEFVKNGPKERIVDNNPNSYIQELQNSIYKIWADRSMEEKYMVLEEMLRQERKAAELMIFKKNIKFVLEKKDYLSDDTIEIIDSIDDIEILEDVFDYVFTASNLEEVEKFLADLR